MDLEFTKTISPEYGMETLQPLVPKGFNLKSATIIASDKLSLSKAIKSTIWTFDLKPSTHTKPSSNQWKSAREALLRSKELIWKDTDKKGRDRIRDLRQSLERLELLSHLNKTIKNNSSMGVRIQIKSLVEPIGRSIKPKHIK